IHGPFGRKLSQAAGFSYADANTSRRRYFEGVFEESQKVNLWNEKMIFAGVKKKDERANLIADLKKATNE
ncbi:Cytochrome c, partial [Lemmus lemmus]